MFTLFKTLFYNLTLISSLFADGILNSSRPRSDNSSYYISSEPTEYIKDKGMSHIGGRPLYPQMQGEIERWHRSVKNIVKIEYRWMCTLGTDMRC